MTGLNMFDVDHPVIGMVHLRALPGSPDYAGEIDSVLTSAVTDASALIEGGVDGLMVENFFDVPFFKDQVPVETVSAMTRACLAISEVAGGRPMGVNVLRNDAKAALAIASTVGAAFVRVNVLSGAMVTDQGVIEGRAAEVMRYRRSIGATDVAVWADVRVKHAAALVVRPMAEEVEELVQRSGAEAVIVSGAGTGYPTPVRDAGAVKAVADGGAEQGGEGTAVLIGSGVRGDDLSELWPVCDGMIVGSHLKQEGRLAAAVDVERVGALMDEVKARRA